jgi:adenine phosphoribosyltransferase
VSVGPPDGNEALSRVAALVRDIPDFPEPGVVFRDITPVLADSEAFTVVAVALAALVGEADVVVGVEARVPPRFGRRSDRRYRRRSRPQGGEAAPRRRLAELRPGVLHGDARAPCGHRRPGTRAFVVDDVLATGGTAAASCELVESVGAEVLGFAAMIELVALGGRERLGPFPVNALLSY